MLRQLVTLSAGHSLSLSLSDYDSTESTARVVNTYSRCQVVNTRRRGPPAVCTCTAARSDSETPHIAQNTEIHEITSAISVRNVVKIGEKLRPLSLRKFSLFRKSIDVHALIKSILAINATVRVPFIWEPTFEFW